MVKNLRKKIQILWSMLSNGYVKGFLPGKTAIYTGPLKKFCVPGMNCYSCPGALGACPIGALQAALNERHRKFPFYVVGYLAAVGFLAGRFICGWLCIFGLIQELLYKIPVPKLKLKEKTDKYLRYLKYAVLAILVIGLPLFYRSEFGAGEPFFCKYICPVGTLQGGIPLVLLNDVLRPALGWLFRWKILLLTIGIVASMVIYRPFCRYICPLGAFYSLFQRISIIRMNYDESSCTDCGSCADACGMNINPRKEPNSAECIRCGDCIKACPTRSLAFTVARLRNKKDEDLLNEKTVS